MTATPDESVQALQRETQRLLGRCMLRLQQYERLIKAMVAHHEISGPINDLETIKSARVEYFARKTLGILVGDLLGSYLVNDEINAPTDAEPILPEDSPASFSMKIEVGLSGADFARTKSGLKELVLLRNDLVHDFINRHDLQSVDGCRGANEALIAAYDRIDIHYEELRIWAEYMERARQKIADVNQQDVIQDMMFNGIAADGSIRWPAAGIVRALREAAKELSVDGWVAVEEAGRWIAKRYPEQTPQKYGCKSWRQVVHESCLFDLEYHEVDGVRTALFREKSV